ncbi:MAG TPA: glyceraldehyde 3-phosphate dehydrogenase NAD-binding domain-containing protein, partial [Flavobacteriales bacterium]|nr:glyceraldehyde 3-phosphate dehydrogenase NAD-binding domain-containing protein [Flavobacteriales bacterium]
MSAKVRIAINGFGRIGRVFTRYLLEESNLELVAINDLTDSVTLAHLLKYDSVHGRFPGEVVAGEKSIAINGRTIQVLAEKDPSM